MPIAMAMDPSAALGASHLAHPEIICGGGYGVGAVRAAAGGSLRRLGLYGDVDPSKR